MLNNNNGKTLNDVFESKYDEIPEHGYILAYYRDKVIFEEYNKGDLNKYMNENKQLLEIHLFNDSKEVRAIQSRRAGWYITAVISDCGIELEDGEELEELKYNQQVRLEHGGLINVVNYISYDKNGMISIQNYRLGEVQKNG